MSITKIDNFDLLNLIESDNKNELFDYILNEWSFKKSLTLGFIYFAIFAKIKTDTEYANAFQKYDILLSDGVGLGIYFKKVFNKNIINLNGTDLLPLFIKYLDSKKIKYAFYGATEENISLSAKKFDPYFFQNGFSQIDFNHIKNNSVLFIGLGTPNQELFIKKHAAIIKEKSLIIVSVGGFFDFSSGKVMRAPAWIRKIKLEFLFRLLMNPKQHLKKNLLNFYLLYFIYKDKKHVSSIK